MERILINGNFLCRSLTGIERYAFEVLRRMDALLSGGDDVALLVPANARFVPEYGRIRLIRSEKEIHGFPKWDLIEFRRQCRKTGRTGLNFSNTAPLGRACGYAFIHDIYAADCPKDFRGLKDTLVKAYSRLNYANICRNARKIFTVSEFSRERIQKRYKVPPERICVAPNGWEHFAAVEEDDSVFEKFPALKEGGFYFTLGSLSRRKNLKWIAAHAERHPEETFAVSGKAISGLVPDELKVLQSLENVALLGYVSDGQVKSLMRRCRAFIFPSYYEGFGIPPLEALSAGAKVIAARSASLPEIYGKAARYIDADNPDCDLNEVLSEEAEPPDAVLARFTYENSARILYEALGRTDLSQSCK